MKNETIEKNWHEIKNKIQTQWTKFNKDEIESFRKDLSSLTGKIQAVYGVGKEHAEKQFDEFKLSVRALIGSEPAPQAPVAPRPPLKPILTTSSMPPSAPTPPGKLPKPNMSH